MHTPENTQTNKPIKKNAHIFLRWFCCYLLLILTSYAQAQLADQKKILVLGDSLSAGYGIPMESSWVNLLQADLKEKNYRIVNASISGETTDGGLRSLPKLLADHQPEIVIIELGANDGLRGFPLKTIRQNLSSLITKSKAYTEKVLLLGMHIPPNYGKRYAQSFHELYQTLAGKFETALVPFLLEDVAIHQNLMQEDRLHPTAEAQPIIKNHVQKALGPLL